jgi:alpha-galactosidase
VGASEIGLKSGASYRLRDLWSHTDATGDGSIKVNLPAHATVIYRISHV